MAALAEASTEVTPLGPESLAWRISGSRTALFGAGSALILQVAHPVVGAGVKDHSIFRKDPWGRLDRTTDSLFTQIFGGDDALAEAARLREFHKAIKGVDARGRRYHALNPEAYFWVHATLFVSTIQIEKYFGTPLTRAEQEGFYAEWRQLGLVLGIRDQDMPRTLDGFERYVEVMLRERLEDNETVRDVLFAVSLREVDPPPWWPLPESIWRHVGKPVGRSAFELTTVGLLPPQVRELLGMKWTRRDEMTLRALGAIVRRGVPLLPAKVRLYPIAYQAKRAA
jgi:uncharacterized protein (DUF2236 family)